MKNGKDGTDGKEDAPTILGLRQLGLDQQFIDPYISIAPFRQYVHINLTQPSANITAEQKAASQTYIDALTKTGVIDTIAYTPTSTTIIMSVASQEEAQEILSRDPIIAARGFGAVNYSPLAL